MSDTNGVLSDDPLHAYLAELSRIPPIDESEEITCVQHVNAEDEMAEACRKRLVEANLNLVVMLAERHRDEEVHILDLIEKGNVGLLRATQKPVDCPTGSFVTHAIRFIESALRDDPENPQSTAVSKQITMAFSSTSAPHRRRRLRREDN